MSILDEQKYIEDDVNPYYKLFSLAINKQKDPIILLYKNTPILFNKAFTDFTKINSVEELGSIFNHFVPYGNYFHAGKIENMEEWVSEFAELPEEKKNVSMLNHKADPYVFALDVQAPVSDYALLTFTDISQDLIKRIMIENDANIDKESLAYNKKYFIHTSKSFYDAAVFNKKIVGIAIMDLMVETVDEEILKDFVANFKNIIRQDDMLVRWGEKQFLLAYLVDSAKNSVAITEKLREKFHYKINISSSVQKNKEEIGKIIENAESALL